MSAAKCETGWGGEAIIRGGGLTCSTPPRRFASTLPLQGRVKDTLAPCPTYLVPNVVLPNSSFCVEGCERQYCGGASTWPCSSAAACQPQRGS
jgi:hypothetical protein